MADPEINSYVSKYFPWVKHHKEQYNYVHQQAI